jgi:hypothetical protein
VSLVDDAMEQVGKLFKENRDLAEQLTAALGRAEKAEGDVRRLTALLGAEELATEAAETENDRLRKERDELDAMLPPLCAHCGERNRDGCHSEHDNSWMCASCYVAAGRGEER